IALVLTLITNPLTMGPIYLFYFGIGCGMVDCTVPTGELDRLIVAVFDFNLFEMASSFGALVGEPYLLMWLGSLPFVVVLSPLAYLFGRKLGDRMEHRRQVRQAKRRQHVLAKDAAAGNLAGTG